MKRLIFACAVLLASCSVTRTTKVTIRDADNIVDGRRTFNVYFRDGRIIEQMYAEEVLNGLSTGVWQYNEDLK
jgi:hypothetical protein